MSDRYKINENALKLYGATQEDYEYWSELTNKEQYSSSTKREFCKRLREGRLVKDKYGNLVRKYRKKR